MHPAFQRSAALAAHIRFFKSSDRAFASCACKPLPTPGRLSRVSSLGTLFAAAFSVPAGSPVNRRECMHGLSRALRPADALKHQTSGSCRTGPGLVGSARAVADKDPAELVNARERSRLTLCPVTSFSTVTGPTTAGFVIIGKREIRLL